MKNTLKKIMKSILLDHFNLYPTALTDRKELISLIHKLHPIPQGKQLIRLGPKGDGGYLVPNDLVGIKACFSPGTSWIIGFEKDCANLGMKVFMADGSVDGTIENYNNFFFIKKYIGATNSGNFITMDEWVNVSLREAQEEDSDLMLQMDIEGYEYETLINITNDLMRMFRIIVVEFHDLDLLWCKPFYKMVSRVFEKILLTHSCVHIHPNNYGSLIIKYGICIPSIMEFTFLRNDRMNFCATNNTYPHPLDSNNIHSNETLELPKCWYMKG